MRIAYLINKEDHACSYLLLNTLLKRNLAVDVLYGENADTWPDPQLFNLVISRVGGLGMHHHKQLIETWLANAKQVSDAWKSQKTARSKSLSGYAFMDATLSVPKFVLLDEYRNLANRDELVKKVLGESPWICKPDIGGRGWGINKVTSIEQAIQHEDDLHFSCIVQQMIFPHVCYRILTSEKVLLKAYKKVPNNSNDFIASISRGSEREVIDEKDVIEFAQRMVGILGGDIMGADVLRDSTGKLWALECNTNPSFDETDDEIAFKWVDFLIEKYNLI